MKRFLLLIVFALTFSVATYAQCPMCRATTQGSNYANKINTGILYLLAFPFVIVGGVGLYWYRNRDKFMNTEEDNALLKDIHPN